MKNLIVFLLFILSFNLFASTIIPVTMKKIGTNIDHDVLKMTNEKVIVIAADEKNAHSMCIRKGYDRASFIHAIDLDTAVSSYGEKLRIVFDVPLQGDLRESKITDDRIRANYKYLYGVNCEKDL